MRKKVARKVSKANPRATATTIPATVPFASRLEEGFAGCVDEAWGEDDVVEFFEVVVDAVLSGF